MARTPAGLALLVEPVAELPAERRRPRPSPRPRTSAPPGVTSNRAGLAVGGDVGVEALAELGVVADRLRGDQEPVERPAADRVVEDARDLRRGPADPVGDLAGAVDGPGELLDRRVGLLGGRRGGGPRRASAVAGERPRPVAARGGTSRPRWKPLARASRLALASSVGGDRRRAGDAGGRPGRSSHRAARSLCSPSSSPSRSWSAPASIWPKPSLTAASRAESRAGSSGAVLPSGWVADRTSTSDFCRASIRLSSSIRASPSRARGGRRRTRSTTVSGAATPGPNFSATRRRPSAEGVPAGSSRSVSWVNVVRVPSHGQRDHHGQRRRPSSGPAGPGPGGRTGPRSPTTGAVIPRERPGPPLRQQDQQRRGQGQARGQGDRPGPSPRSARCWRTA